MQKVQTRVPQTSISQEPAVKLKTEGKAIKVLLIDSDPREAYILRKKMSQAGAFSLEYADKLSSGLERLAGGGIRVLLLNPSVADSRGLESIGLVHAQFPGVLIFILSSRDNEKEKAEALKRGAQEYLVKGKINTDLLTGTIRRAITKQYSSTKTEQKPLKAESGESPFRDIVKYSPDGIIIVDQKGKIRFTNPAVEFLFGCKAARLLGESLDSLPAVKGGKTELGIVRGDGAKRIAEVKIAEIRYQGEKAYLASLRDITKHKQDEEDIRTALMEAESIRATSVAAATKAQTETALAKEKAESLRATLDKANEETRLVRAEAEAYLEKAMAKATAEVKVAQDEAELSITKAAAIAEEKARAAREEADTIKTASAAEVVKANREARLAREEAESTKTASAKAIARANKEAKIAREEAEEIKAASAEAIARANKEAKTAREEAEETKTISAEAIARANNEARIAKEEAEAAKAALTKAKEEARLTKEEIEDIKTSTAKAVAKANKETRLAKEETEDFKKSCAKAIAKSSEEARLARGEAEAVKQASAKAVAKATEDARLARQEAEETKIATTMAIARADEEARTALEEAEAAKTASEEAMLKTAEKLYHLDPMQSEFMSNIVHELRAPLHSILAFTRLLIEGDVSDNETQTEFLKIIADQSEHLHRLIDELVDISPIESERFNIRQESVTITELLQSCMRDCYSMAKLKNILVTENIPVQLPEAEVDIQRFKQLMFNLLGNAIKFSNDNGSIIVSAEVRDDKLLVKITDHGIGIPAEAMPSLFEKYYQVKGTDRIGGLGLGLYISRRIVEAHGGEIRAVSTEGSGSTFSFTIPLQQDKR